MDQTELKARTKAIIREFRKQRFGYFLINKHFEACMEEMVTEEDTGKTFDNYELLKEKSYSKWFLEVKESYFTKRFPGFQKMHLDEKLTIRDNELKTIRDNILKDNIRIINIDEDINLTRLSQSDYKNLSVVYEYVDTALMLKREPNTDHLSEAEQNKFNELKNLYDNRGRKE